MDGGLPDGTGTHDRREMLTQIVPFRSAINGILTMDTFKEDFNTGYKDKSGHLNMAPREVALIVAMLSAGTAAGALLSAPIGDRWGRRLSLIVAIGIFCIGGICQVCATGVPLLVVGRCVSLCVFVTHLSIHPSIHSFIHSSIYPSPHTTCASVARLLAPLLPFPPRTSIPWQRLGC
jgi:MFS family permease